MKKKTAFVSFFATAIIVLVTLPPVVSEKVLWSQDEHMIPIVTRIYQRHGIREIITEVPEREVNRVKQCLERLNDALEKSDKKEILACVSFLRERQVFDRANEEIYSLLKKPFEPSTVSTTFPKQSFSAAETSISNFLCYVNVVGGGLMFFTVGHILAALANMGIMLPFPFYIIVLILTHLIPVRILLPIGSINLEEGKISAFGLGGLQRKVVANETIGVALLGFTGITINIPFGETQGFLFVSGFSLLAFEGGVFD